MSKVASIRLSDLISIAWSSLRRNKLRSFLTIGAISVAVAVMMFLISLGMGLEQLTLGNVARSNTLLSLNVTSVSELQPLNAKAIEKMEKVAKVKAVLPKVTVDGEISLENQKTNVTIIGVDPEYLEITDDTKLEAGRYYRKDDQKIMVVTTTFLKLFGLDQGKTPLVVYGAVLNKEKYGGRPAMDDISVSGVVTAGAVAVYLPRQYLAEVLGDKMPNYDNAKVIVGSLDDIEPVRDELIKQGFKVSTVVDTVQEIKKVFYWIQLILGSLGLIAIFVATIGMFNTLTISLLERTREIGIMKALGVKRTDINRLFIAESLLMGIIGGTSGVLAAFFLQQVTIFSFSLLASFVPESTVPKLFQNPWYLALGFFCFALLIAVATGIYPARRAARLNPIDAIRYE